MKKLLILTLLLACACKPTRIPKRFWHLLVSDTVTHVDTVLSKPIMKDTSFYFYQKDTLIIKEKGAVLRYYTHTDSTVYIQMQCPPDKTINKHTREKIYYPVDKKLPAWVWFAVGVAVLLSFILIFRR